MDTKSKVSRKLFRLICVFLIILLAVGFVALFPNLWKNSRASKVCYYEREDFVQELYRGGYVLYYRMLERDGIVNDLETSPVDVFFPGSRELLEHREKSQSSMGSLSPLDKVRLSTRLEEASNRLYDQWAEEFDGVWSYLEHFVIRDDTVYFGNGSNLLARYATGDTGGSDSGRNFAEELRQLYDYYVILDYDERGGVEVRNILGSTPGCLRKMTDGDYQYLWINQVQENLGESLAYDVRMQAMTPRNMTVVYGVPKGDFLRYSNQRYAQQEYNESSVREAGYNQLYFTACLLAMLLGAAISLLGEKKAKGGLPLEISAALLALAYFLREIPLRMLIRALKGEPFLQFGWEQGDGFTAIPSAGEFASLWGCLAGYLVVLLLFSAVALAVCSLLQVRAMGLRQYVLEQTLAVRLIAQLRKLTGHFWRWITSIDLRKNRERLVLQVAGVNLLITGLLCCCAWPFGLAGAVIYNALVYWFLRRYFRELQRQYRMLLDSAETMAQGELDVAVDPNLGVFNPLGEALRQVQRGFRKAVDSEVKSRGMKTELVANVSHDLKTPLTAIITYIGLLKDEGISPEERRKYVATLDAKSQRLKRLIDDLFEMSKVTTGDVAVKLGMVDLAAVIRQVEMELEEELSASRVKFRHRFQVEKAPAMLDGEKMSRVFENLFLNIAKHAMPNTRAYVDLALEKGEIFVTLSNVSREPLDFDPAGITERFARGDRSRATEGSGLGLAIAKSFVELQGGRLEISTDGDLFKASITLPSCATQLIEQRDSETGWEGERTPLAQ